VSSEPCKLLEVVSARDDHVNAIDLYAHRAVTIAKGDRAVLQGLGLEVLAVQHGQRFEGPADAPTNLRVLPGQGSGSVIVRWSRPRGAAAFLAQYKLEPLSADAPPSNWLPAEGFATKNLDWSIDNLQPIAKQKAGSLAVITDQGALAATPTSSEPQLMGCVNEPPEGGG
jgi:hypothetical protein